MSDLISIIITTKNSELTLKDLLKSIKAQNYPHYEIIIVDNFSQDRTMEIAKRYTKNFFQKGPERSCQRNYGTEKAKGKYLLFLDSDMILPSSSLEEAIRAFKNNLNLKGLIVPEVSVGQGFWAKVTALEKSCYQGDELIEAARFFEKKAFFEIGGYDKNLVSAEDWDLHLRFKEKFSVGRIKTPLIHQEGKISLKKILAKKLYYAKHFPRYRKKHPQIAKRQMNLIFRGAFSRNKNKLLIHPLLTIGLVIMKFLQSIVGITGYIKGKK